MGPSNLPRPLSMVAPALEANIALTFPPEGMAFDSPALALASQGWTGMKSYDDRRSWELGSSPQKGNR